MPEEKEPPRPHGDKLGSAVGTPQFNTEDNHAQVESDAAPDAVGGTGHASRHEKDLDEDDGAQRKRQYKNGASLVSGLD